MINITNTILKGNKVDLYKKYPLVCFNQFALTTEYHKNWRKGAIFTGNIALNHFKSLCRYTNTFIRAITRAMRYENHIFAAKITNSRFEKKKNIFQIER